MKTARLVSEKLDWPSERLSVTFQSALEKNLGLSPIQMRHFIN